MSVEYEPLRQQITRGTSATLRVTFYDDDAVIVDPGVVTVTITRLDGTSLAAAAATSGTGATERTYALDASATATLDVLDVVWTSATLGSVAQIVEVLGAQLFTIARARSFGDRVLADRTKYPLSLIEAARIDVDDEFRAICGTSFVPRRERIVVDGGGATALVVPRTRLAAIVTIEIRDGVSWASIDASTLAAALVDDDTIILTDGTIMPRGIANVRVTVEHGWRAVPPLIAEAALLAARYKLTSGRFDSRVTSVSTEYGTEQYWTPNLSARGSALHELPRVDAILREYRDVGVQG